MLELQQRAIEFNSIIEKHEKIRYRYKDLDLDLVMFTFFSLVQYHVVPTSKRMLYAFVQVNTG